ncbi:MAG TPA: hypothetical protein VFZ91_10555 [Allosphingosinicella sp.]
MQDDKKPGYGGGYGGGGSGGSYGGIHAFYMGAVRDTLDRGDRAEIEALLASAREVKAKYNDLDGVIAALEGAAKSAK